MQSLRSCFSGESLLKRLLVDLRHSRTPHRVGKALVPELSNGGHGSLCLCTDQRIVAQGDHGKSPHGVGQPSRIESTRFGCLLDDSLQLQDSRMLKNLGIAAALGYPIQRRAGADDLKLPCMLLTHLQHSLQIALCQELFPY